MVPREPPGRPAGKAPQADHRARSGPPAGPPGPGIRAPRRHLDHAGRADDQAGLSPLQGTLAAAPGNRDHGEGAAKGAGPEGVDAEDRRLAELAGDRPRSAGPRQTHGHQGRRGRQGSCRGAEERFSRRGPPGFHRRPGPRRHDPGPDGPHRLDHAGTRAGPLPLLPGALAEGQVSRRRGLLRRQTAVQGQHARSTGRAWRWACWATPRPSVR